MSSRVTLLTWEGSESEDRKRGILQVDVVKLQLLQANINCRTRFGKVIGDLPCHEKPLSRDAGLFYGDAQFGLGVVPFGYVKMGIAKTNSCLDGVNSCTVNLSIVLPVEQSGASTVRELL